MKHGQILKSENIFQAIPDVIEEEIFEILARSHSVKIERIISKGHQSPESGWYDETQNEWVIVLKGEAIIAFESGEQEKLVAGSYINIPAHTKHRVAWTKPNSETVWLAVHY
jgi:cupin 2 domain-containing protein